jgi:hypothetical protein
MKYKFIMISLGLLLLFTWRSRLDQISYQSAPISLADSNGLTTPKGHQIKFIEKNASYFLQWKQGDEMKTLDYSFSTIEEGNGRTPRFVEESRDYIHLRAGCGNPCWIGIFLPLYKQGQPIIINEYMAVDLKNGLVASIRDSNIEIVNLRTSWKRVYNPGICDAAFLGYCIDKAYFENGKLMYSWIPDTTDATKSKVMKEIKIK